jgi:Zn-dependent protease with chaperone function
MLKTALYLSCTVAGSTLIGKYVSSFVTYLFIRAKKKVPFRTFLKLFSFKEDLFTFIGISVLFLPFITFILMNDEPNSYFFFFATLLSGTVMLSYSFLIHPLYFVLSNKEYSENQYYNNWINTRSSTKIHVRIIEKDMLNAFATGVVPFLKVILVGKKTIETLPQEEVEAMLFHELGHVAKNHLAKLFFANFVWLSIVSLFFMAIKPCFEIFQNSGLYYAMSFSVCLGVGSLFFVGFVQKRLEKEADSYAAQHIDKKKLWAIYSKN